MSADWVCEKELDDEHAARNRRDWVIRKTQCKTCMEMQDEYGTVNYGGDGRPVWVIYRKGGEFGCRPTFAEAVTYAQRKASQ